ncbi:MAG: DUF4292 domain-containing protein [Muribaculaceae bacterium]|nr:DUF4292 domain-containing protein [Muribaculaceae bacterium]
MLRKAIFIFSTLCAITFASLLSGCRSSKAVTAPSMTENHVKQYPNTPEGKLQELLDSYKEWSDVSMSVKCNLRTPKSMSVSGKATMISGNEIKLSLRMFGFEVAGLYADRDSIYVYEKLNHTMIAESMSRVSAATGLDLNGMQDLLLGHITNPDNHNNILSGFKSEVSDAAMTLTMKKKNYDMVYTLSLLNGAVLKSLDVTASGKGSAVCRYAPALITPAGPVSTSADLTVKFGRHTLEASLNWSLESASWNKGIATGDNIPKGYRRITTDQLLKALGAF